MFPLREYGSTITRYVEAEGYLEIAIAGALFEHQVTRLRVGILRHMAEHGTLGTVVDLSQATLVPFEGATHPLPQASAAGRALRLCPVAIVVKPEVEQMCLEWAWEMAYAGFMRGVFLSLCEARSRVQSRVGAPGLNPEAIVARFQGPQAS